MKILITGGSGYIGKNLIFNYQSKFFDFINFDKKNNINIKDIKKLPNDLDFVIHLAAISGIKDCEENKKEAFYSNIVGSYNILDLANMYNIPVLLASSQAAKNPTSSFYAKTKYMMEQKALENNTKFNVKNKILRFSNVYGGIDYLQDKTSVVANFLNAKNKNEKLKIHGDGKQTRDFIHVYDLIHILLHIGIRIKNIQEEIIDIGTGVETRIIDVAKCIGDYEFIKNNSSGINSSVADISILKKYYLNNFRYNIKDFLNGF
jgi:UDP-glucose 4-epimerase